MIEKYLSQVAPVPFSDSFKFKDKINELLREKIQVSYHILLNGETAITEHLETRMTLIQKLLTISMVLKSWR